MERRGNNYDGEKKLFGKYILFAPKLAFAIKGWAIFLIYTAKIWDPPKRSARSP